MTLSSQLITALGKIFSRAAVAPITVANLPSASVAGKYQKLTVSDATVTTFASTVVGGGANTVPVYSDGTNWKIG